MTKLLLLLLIPIVLLALILFTKQPKMVYDSIFGRVLGEATTSFNPSPTSPNNQSNPISQTEDSIKNTAGQTTNNIKNNLQQSLQNGLNSIFGQSSNNSFSNNPSPVSVQLVGSSSNLSNQSVTFIDLAKDNNFKINLAKGSKYYIQFQNAPSDSCLYVDEKKYPIDNNTTVEIQILSSGNYPLNINTCNLNDKHIGELDVQ